MNAAALRAGGSSSDVLAALGASDAQQKLALSDLTTQGEGYRQQQQGALKQGLQQQAAYQQRDQQEYDRERGALTESGQRNIFGAVDGLSQVASYALGKAGGESVPEPSSTLPSKRRVRHGASGLPVPEGMWGLMG